MLARALSLTRAARSTERGRNDTHLSTAPLGKRSLTRIEAFRFNERHGGDGDRFLDVVKAIAGRRLTYKGLTGNLPEAEPAF